jgi:hypothetical protein
VLLVLHVTKVFQDLVECSRRVHRGNGLLGVKEVVPAEIDRVSLTSFEFFHNLATVLRELFKDGHVGRIFLLQKVSPVKSDVKVRGSAR